MVPVRIFWRFADNHGFALASNIAFSMLLSIFPFLLLITGVTVWVGGEDLGTVLQSLLALLLPDAIADILQPDVDAVIAERTGSLLSVSLIIFLVTLTSLVESLREGLNRAYGYYERRSILSRRLMGLLAIFGAILVMLAVASGLFAAPLAWNILLPHMPWLNDFHFTFDVVRLGIALPVLTCLSGGLAPLAAHAAHRMGRSLAGRTDDAGAVVGDGAGLQLLSVALCPICQSLCRARRGRRDTDLPAYHFNDFPVRCRGQCLADPLAAATAGAGGQAHRPCQRLDLSKPLPPGWSG